MHSGKKTKLHGMGQVVMFSFLVTMQLGCAAQSFEVLDTTKGSYWTLLSLDFCRTWGPCKLRLKLSIESHWGWKSGDFATPEVFCIISGTRSQSSLFLLPSCQFTPLAAAQALFFPTNAQGPRQEIYVLFGFLPFCQFSSGQGTRNKKEFKHRLHGITLFITQTELLTQHVTDPEFQLIWWKEKTQHVGNKGTRNLSLKAQQKASFGLLEDSQPVLRY